MVIKDLVPVEWSSQRVLTTAQLAEHYECEVRHISENFKNNESRFKEGKHYFRLDGEALKTFKRYSDDIGLPINKFSPTLYLWTERGAARHAKMLSTDRAWEVFEELEDFYFIRNTSALVAPAAKEKPALESKRRKFNFARVYVFLMSDYSVKIGYTKRFCRRMSEIKRQNKLVVKNIFFTAIMSCENARLVERCTKEIFSSSKLNGEFFSVKFDEACKAVEYFTKLVAATPIVSDLERGGKILKLAGRKFD